MRPAAFAGTPFKHPARKDSIVHSTSGMPLPGARNSNTIQLNPFQTIIYKHAIPSVKLAGRTDPHTSLPSRHHVRERRRTRAPALYLPLRSIVPDYAGGGTAMLGCGAEHAQPHKVTSLRPHRASASSTGLLCRRRRGGGELEVGAEKVKRGVGAQRLGWRHSRVQRLVVHHRLHVVRVEGVGRVVVEQERVARAALLLLHTVATWSGFDQRLAMMMCTAMY